MTATELLIAVGALLLAVLGGWPLTAGVLRLAARSSDAGTTEPPATRTTEPPADVSPDPDAGTTETAADADRTPHGTDGGDGPTGPRARSALRGGTWIGVLERAAIAGAILAGYPTAVAFVIAVKGLGRYPEIREHPEASERFVIGTLASMIWAAGVAGLGRALIGGWPG